MVFKLFRRKYFEYIAQRYRHHTGIEVVIAILPLAQHMESEIDLCGRK
jgi:hypothetical protein